MKTDDELVEELKQRAKGVGEAAGLYLESAVPLATPAGLVKPLQLVVRYRVGDRAWLAAADVGAIEARQREIDALEEAVGMDDVEVLRREADEGPLGQLERGE